MNKVNFLSVSELETNENDLYIFFTINNVKTRNFGCSFHSFYLSENTISYHQILENVLLTRNFMWFFSKKITFFLENNLLFFVNNLAFSMFRNFSEYYKTLYFLSFVVYFLFKVYFFRNFFCIIFLKGIAIL